MGVLLLIVLGFASTSPTIAAAAAPAPAREEALPTKVPSVPFVDLAAPVDSIDDESPTPAPQPVVPAPPTTTVPTTTTTTIPTTTTTTIPKTTTTVPGETDETPVGSEVPAGSQAPDDTTAGSVVSRPSVAPRVRESDIPVSSIVLALAVLAAVGTAAVLIARREREMLTTDDATIHAPEPGKLLRDEQSDTDDSSVVDVETLEFLVELGEALLNAGDAVGHVEATIRNIAEINGIRGLGLLVLPASLVLSLHRGDSVVTEVSTSTSAPLRLDQIDDVFRLVNDAERAEVSTTEGLRALEDIRTRPSPSSNNLRLGAYVLATVGLAMLLRGSWTELALAAILGVVIGGLRLATESQQAAYQVFWPLISAATASAAVFATARVFTDLAVFPALVAPLVTFLPGGLLTIGVLELATGQIISGASRLAAGAMKLTLLAIGIVAGAQLVGVPGGDLRAGGTGTFSALVPWVGVALFGVGIARFNGARPRSLVWILVALYVAYAGQVLGGLFFGSALSAFFGAMAMTPVALFASRQRFGPTPLVTFLPGFWLLVPGALGLEGVTRVIGQGAAGNAGALATTVTSMIGISLGLLLGLIISGADPARPWSDSSRRRW